MGQDWFDKEEIEAAKETLFYLRHVFCSATDNQAAQYVAQIEKSFIQKLSGAIREEYESIIEDVKTQFGKGHAPEENVALQKRVSAIMQEPYFQNAHFESTEEFMAEMAIDNAHIFGAPPKIMLH